MRPWNPTYAQFLSAVVGGLVSLTLAGDKPFEVQLEVALTYAEKVADRAYDRFVLGKGMAEG